MCLEKRLSIVVIDDNQDLLTKLQTALARELAPDGVEIRTWKPDVNEKPRDEFQRRVDENTVLVVTDYDLTQNGLTGLFGVSIVSWCQSRAIPVGDFSRANVPNLPKQSTLFELRVPSSIDEGARYTARMFRGFRDLREELASDAVNLKLVRSPAEVLATVLKRPQQESQFALYMSSLGAASASLSGDPSFAPPSDDITINAKKERILAYVLGHVLANAVLRYPGPILSERALCAYVATTESEAEAIGVLFREAIYVGPFSAGATYYWRSDVDRIIDRESATVEDTGFDTWGAFNRAVIEKRLGAHLASHECLRCEGRNGGYLCPFTARTVCERADCSVAANSWIPAGADVSRIEREFYDEWAPLLGL